MYQLLLAAAALAAQPQPQPRADDGRWLLVYSGPQHISYLDRQSVRLSGRLRTVRTRSDYAQAANGIARTFYQQNVNCARRTLMPFETIDQDRSGRVVSQRTTPLAERRLLEVEPGSPGERLLILACGLPAAQPTPQRRR